MSLSILKTVAGLSIVSAVSIASAAGPTPETIHIQRCSACHYVDGKSAGPEFPNIAGQYETYLMKALKLFRENKRDSDAMELVASLHKQQELVILASYYARQTPADSPPIAAPDQTLAERGKQLYTAERVYGIACVDCHGPDAMGYVRQSPRTKASRAIPRLAGQQPSYLKAALQKYNADESQSGMCTMRKAGKALDPGDIDALVEYLASK
ncbi:MAG: c-type cytochrome [Thiobacillaceae bacterium]|jgi:cytochrome c553|nr:c-type cytochrome [Thiobacillaceae bacterium]